MKISNKPYTSGDSSTQIPKSDKNQKFGRIFHQKKNVVVLLPTYGYSNEVIVGDRAQNDSTSEDEYANLEKTLYSSNASLAPKIPKTRRKKKKNKKRIPKFQVKHSDKTDIEETPDLMLDSWDAYLQIEHPELFDKDFKLPDATN